MRSVILMLALSVMAYGQTITFVPQAVSRVPGLSEYRVYISDNTGQPLQVRAAVVMATALQQGIATLGYVGLQTWINTLNHRSPAHWASITIEVMSWTLTAIEGAQLVKFKERWATALPPVLAGGLTLSRTILEREHKDLQVPNDLIPPLIAVPASGEVDYAIFAAVK
jgi:hypothetical protein